MKCVWMRAGVIDYKLCEREYDCERCDFDRAIRRRAPTLTAEEGEHSCPTGGVWERECDRFEVRGCIVVGTLFYTPGHVWMRVESGARVRVGLDDFAQRLLGRVYSVSLPAPGDHVDPRSRSWTVSHSAGESVVTIPVTGSVYEVNQRLSQRPSLANDDPYGRGAAMVLESRNLLQSLDSAHYGAEAKRWYEREFEELLRAVESSRAEPERTVGSTRPDGGALMPDLCRHLQSETLGAIIDSFLSPQRRWPSTRVEADRSTGDR